MGIISDEGVRLLSEQVYSIDSDEIRPIYLRIFAGFIQMPSIEARPAAHGYIDREMRAYFGEEWYFSAVLNKQWVLFYFRWPAFRDRFGDAKHVLDTFPAAEQTKAKDIKLRLSTLARATQVTEFLSGRL